MSYILMTKMQYLHLTGVIPRFSNTFENSFIRENKKRFERNHPMACKNLDEEYKKSERIYQKFKYGHIPKEPLSNTSLTKAIKICSEQPSKCLYLEDTLHQLGYYNIYSYEDRFNALLITTTRGNAVLVDKGFSGGGSSIPKSKDDGFIEGTLNTGSGLAEAALVTSHNTGWDISARMGSLGHGIMQFTKEGSIEDATRVAKESYAVFSGKVKKELSDNAQKAVDENMVLQTKDYVLENTVGVVSEEIIKNLPESVSVFGGLFLGTLFGGRLNAITPKKTIVNPKKDRFKDARHPISIQDQMALDAAKNGAGQRIITNLNDTKYKGMDKWEYKVKSAEGKDSVIHYVVNPKTNERMDFKFKKRSDDAIGRSEK